MVTYNDCINKNNIIYCNIENGKLIVGNNSTTLNNGAFNSHSFTRLTISEKIGEKKDY